MIQLMVYWETHARLVAQQALKIQRDKDSIATIFTVYDRYKSWGIFDLSKPQRVYDKELWEKEGVLKEHKKR